MIRVNDDYVILVDSLEYTVCEDKHKVTTDKKGNVNPVYKPIGHFMTLQKALEFTRDTMIKEQLRAREYDLIQTIIVVQDVQDFFENVFNKILYGEEGEV